MEDIPGEDNNVLLTAINTGEKSNGDMNLNSVPSDGEVNETTEKPVKHARFNIEKVGSPTATEHSHNQNTMHDMDTIGYATHEAVPLTMFYRNDGSVPGHARQRPTLAELHKGFDELDEQDGDDALLPSHKDEESVAEVKNAKPQATGMKFGWIKGVLVPCLLNIWGVILYLRLPWLTGQSGILVVTAIILLSAVVTTITTLSMSAICTNGEVKGGGAYYLISRSLGPEFGGSIGIIFSLANAVGVALYVIGFGETVQQIMERSNFVMVDKLNDIRIIGILVIIMLLGITMIGLDWVIRTQLFLLLILILSMVDYAIGTFSGSVLEDLEVQRLQGFSGYSKESFSDNFFPEFRGESFFSTFSIFFPAATGILAGVNISGDLKDPQSAIPKGTLTAIGLTTVVYIILAWMIGASNVKDAMGIAATVAAVTNGTISNVNSTILPSAATISTTITTTLSSAPSCIPDCKYGLLNDYQLMERFSLVGPLVLAGIFAATLSSALASLVGSPKTFQAVCRDDIFKGLSFFGKGIGPGDEPRRAYVLTFFISTGFILIGQLDLIAPIISNFFLMSYALINYSVFAASLGKSPGWRPSFRFYNMWLSLFGCVICVGIMFLINWWAALVTIVMVMSLYKYVDFKKPEINWGSSGQAHTYIKALKFAHTLNKIDTHVKNFRPQCLVLAGAPSTRANLVHLVNYMTKQVGMMICGQVVIKSDGMSDISSVAQEKWLRQKKIKSFLAVTTAPTLRQGARSLMQCAGLGKLRPNIVVLGFKNNWQNESAEKVDEYINIIHDSFEASLSVAILRMPTGAVEITEDSDDEYDEELDFELDGAFQSESNLPTSNDDDEPTETNTEELNAGQNGRQSTTPLLKREEGSDSKLPTESNEEESSEQNNVESNDGSNTTTPMLTRVKGSKRRKPGAEREQKSETILTMAENPKGYIDVWWMFDDGGLTMLLPYLLSRNKKWKGCALRVLTSTTADKKLKSNQIRMASLLKKFRITFSGIVEVQGANSRPSQKSIDQFCEKRIKDEVTADEPLDKKTLRQIRLGELMKEYSHEAKLVVITMPVARKNVVSNFLYMSWLDVISVGLEAPIFLVRGNQTSVLTFYS